MFTMTEQSARRALRLHLFFGRQILRILHRELKVYRNLPQQVTAILPAYNVK